MNISRQKLIEELNTTTEYGFYGEFMDGSEVAYTLRELMQIIKSQPPADQWIPCSERRPRKNEVIIGTFQNDKGKTMVVTDTYFPCLLNEPWKLVAWMPLPEPFKGEENV